MVVTSDEITAAFGRPIEIRQTEANGKGMVDIVCRPLWCADTEDEAKQKLLAEIVRRGKDSAVVEFRTWPSVRERDDGKCGGYARGRFLNG